MFCFLSLAVSPTLTASTSAASNIQSGTDGTVCLGLVKRKLKETLFFFFFFFFFFACWWLCSSKIFRMQKWRTFTLSWWLTFQWGRIWRLQNGRGSCRTSTFFKSRFFRQAHEESRHLKVIAQIRDLNSIRPLPFFVRRGNSTKEEFNSNPK